MWIDSVRNSGVTEDQVISGPDDVQVQGLSLGLKLSARSRIYVNSILTVSPEAVEKKEKLIAKIEVASVDGKVEPRQYGPYGHRSGDLQAQLSFVADIDFELEPGEFTVRIVASISQTGADAYRLRAQGSCRMTVIGVSEDDEGR